MAALARHQFGHHLALRHGAVRQHGFAGNIANGPDVAHRGAALVVDAQRIALAVQLQLSSPQPCVRGRRPTAINTRSAGNRVSAPDAS
ncbi:hypothetical protein G6F23_014582 [Rhizopus arrhizus]|nr:hypothetical protein G6F23_014582 [Rhizopus arrhizus]